MFYRVAEQDEKGNWEWKSDSPVQSLQALLQWMKLFKIGPNDRIKVVFARTKEDLQDQIEVLNKGGETGLSSKEFFVKNKLITADTKEVGFTPGSRSVQTSIATSQQNTTQVIVGLEHKRLEREIGPGGNVDLPYRFSLPLESRVLLKWVELLGRYQRGELES